MITALDYMIEPDLTQAEKDSMLKRIKSQPSTRLPWTYTEALHRARLASIKRDEPQIVIIDLDYNFGSLHKARNFTFCDWNDYDNQHMDERIVKLEITRGKITEDFR